VIAALENLTPQVTVPTEIARKARRAIDRMLELA
jgi:quinolinate synthase